MLSKSSWIVCPIPRPHAHCRLFCLPYAGGGTAAYQTWINTFPANIEVCLIQPPGREKRIMERPFRNISPFVDSLMQAIEPYLDRQFAVFGHSLGALTGFELARRIRRQGYSGLVWLFASGRSAPQTPSSRLPIHDLPDRELLEELRDLGGTPDIILRNTELIELVLPVLRADLAINETYVYEHDRVLDCPISVFGGLRDKSVTEDQINAWCHQTECGCSVAWFDGDHFFIHQCQNQVLKRILHDLQPLIA